MSDALNSDKQFIAVLTDITLKNLKKEDFRIRHLAREAGVSTSTLNRRLKRICGKSGNEFIRETRLRKAHDLLKEKSVNVSEVSYAVGFSSPAYFSACFHEYFGYPPKDVRQKNRLNVSGDSIAVMKEPTKTPGNIREDPLLRKHGKLIFFLFAAAIAVFIYSVFSDPSSSDDLRSSDGRISVAVMPFENLTGNKTWNCIQVSLISYLASFGELSVCEKEAVDLLVSISGNPGKASITPSMAASISKKLDTRLYISGSISESGARTRINAQVVYVKTGEVIRSFIVEGDSGDQNIFGTLDTFTSQVRNFLVTAKMVAETNPDLRPYSYTNSPMAFEYFVNAHDALQKMDITGSLSWFLKTVEADSCFIPAMIFLSMRYGELGDYSQARKWCLKAYSIKDHAHIKDRNMIGWYHAVLFGTPDEEIRYLKQYVSDDGNVPMAFWQLGNAYVKQLQYENAIPEYEKTLDIYKKWKVKPMMVDNYITLINAYHHTRQYRKEKRTIKTATEDFPDDSWRLLRDLALIAYARSDTMKAKRYVEKYRRSIEEMMPSSEILLEIASLYTESGDLGNAEKKLREAYSLDPDNPVVINQLAYLLIDRELNTNEGLKLAENGLDIMPGADYLLHTQGWGLSKSGKYVEALEALHMSWQSRTKYSHELYLHIEEVRKKISTLE